MVFWALKTFDQLPKSVGSVLAVDRIFRSIEKSQKIWSTDYETFDQLKKHNFDQVKFDQVIIPHVQYIENLSDLKISKIEMQK
jgi:uncharacterized protein YaaN involved in tellurite resistance